MTLTELLVVISILMVIAGLAVPSISLFQKEAALNNSVGNVVNVLKTAQAKSVASEGDSVWGVKFDASVSPNQYILFKGSDYAGRDVNFGQVFKLPDGISFSTIDLSGGDEVVFGKILGTTSQIGSITLVFSDNPAKSRTFYLDAYGAINAVPVPACDDSCRLRDSRHVHFDYSRVIDTAAENLVLNFEGGTQKVIPFASNISGGQFFWTGEIVVAGEKQILAVHTHHLNSPDTQFCVHRLGTQNSKSVGIDISGDPAYPASSPVLIQYQANGTTSKGNSIFVFDPVWQ